MEAPSTRVVFFQVQNALAKLKIICEIAETHFKAKEHFLILVEDQASLDFVDDLLWKSPDTSFLPHVASDEPTKDLIAITKTKNNVNQGRVAFNLCSTPLMIDSPFRIIYEFEDLTNPNKNRLSSLRFDAYKAAHFLIESRSPSVVSKKK